MRDIFCAVTDLDWFDCLRRQPDVPEINFWKPTPRPFKAVGEGGIFAFKLKSPLNKIAGFGVLTTSADAQIDEAWNAFGRGNGVKDLETFVSKIRAIRKSPEVNQFSFIGVRVLVHHVFFPEDRWFDPPADFSQNIVQGKTYTTDTDHGQTLLAELEDRAGGFPDAVAPRHGFPGLSAEPQAAYGSPIPVRPRLGQGTFRINVIRAYQNACAVTGTRLSPVLEAAHILPFSEGGPHAIENGILLRKDIHALFDAGLATFDAQYRLMFSPQIATLLRDDDAYRCLQGASMRLPTCPASVPSNAFLSWHRNKKFKSS